VDFDGSGQLEFSEFVQLIQKLEQEQCSAEQTFIKNARAAFSLFDKDLSGTVDVEEFAICYNDLLGRTASKEELQEIMHVMDEDNSGAIDFDEFLRGMRYYKRRRGEQEEKRAAQGGL
jgi:Ca2+-binding EF-hand superfamily protein